MAWRTFISGTGRAGFCLETSGAGLLSVDCQESGASQAGWQAPMPRKRATTANLGMHGRRKIAVVFLEASCGIAMAGRRPCNSYSLRLFADNYRMRQFAFGYTSSSPFVLKERFGSASPPPAAVAAPCADIRAIGL